jgi:hypothetical protein
MKRRTKIIILLAISIITLIIGIHYKYLKAILNGQYVEKKQHLNDWIYWLEGMEKIQRVHSGSFGKNWDSGLKRIQRINYLCYFLFVVGAVSGIAFLSILMDKGDKEDIR